MARRADHTREELKELAIAAGLKIIRNQGIKEFSARRVAANIGYTVGTIYNVFGDYDNLILHINACTLDEWYNAMCAHLKRNRQKSPVHALAQSYMRYSQTHTPQWLMLFEHHLPQGHPLPDWYAPKMKRFFSLLEEQLLATVIKDRKSAQQAAHTLWAGIHGICILALTGKLEIAGAMPAERMAAQFIDNYLRGLITAQKKR